MKRAFTLIELLVVIAIIAILAAILFPVFAQAKESAKITAALSQTKQMGTGFAIYTADADDNYPMAMMKRPDGALKWGQGLLTPTPNDAVTTSPWDTDARRAAAATSWGNSVYPYIKNWDLYNIQSAPEFKIAQTFTRPGQQVHTVLSMNGLMHCLSSSSINAPSTAILLWPGAGAASIEARHIGNPALNCLSGDTCRFNPGGDPDPTGEGLPGYGGGVLYTPSATSSAWVFSRRRAPFVRTDTSAKILPVGTVIDPNYIQFGPGILNDPFASVDAKGANGSYWPCNFDGNGDPVYDNDNTKNYPCYFRPDRTK